MQTTNSIGEILIKARLSSGYTQKEIADFTRISRSTYSHIEANYRKPSIEFLLRLCVLYKENPLTYLLPLMPPDYLDSQPQYLNYLTNLSKIKYKAGTKRSKKRKKKCWSGTAISKS